MAKIRSSKIGTASSARLGRWFGCHGQLYGGFILTHFEQRADHNGIQLSWRSLPTIRMERYAAGIGRKLTGSMSLRTLSVKRGKGGLLTIADRQFAFPFAILQFEYSTRNAIISNKDDIFMHFL
ncbi:MAG: hypothetical protein HY735_03180 [Verrucomicrobia bacterium]|nr:hypothetical protein [Verrucomicrobiota bacterium]